MICEVARRGVVLLVLELRSFLGKFLYTDALQVCEVGS